MSAADADTEMLRILMYHSVSDGKGPTSISESTFRRQIETLSDCGYGSISAEACDAWLQRRISLSARSIWITFDDGFADFYTTAFPILQKYGFTATVFLVSRRMGRTENWEGADTDGPRRLLTWTEVEDLGREGVGFGGHGATHADLTALSPADLRTEIRRSREDIEEHTGTRPCSFAAPYGRSGPREQEEIRKWFDISVGTRLQRALRDVHRQDLPRIEMHYFRETRRWRAFLEGRGNAYFALRRGLRAARSVVTGP